MDKLEKIVKGIECCLPLTAKNGIADCKSCPYDRQISLDSGVTECIHELMVDILTYLRANEPRILRWKELHVGDVVYVEDIGTNHSWYGEITEIVDDAIFFWGCNNGVAMLKSNYRRSFWCWTSKPNIETPLNIENPC